MHPVQLSSNTPTQVTLQQQVDTHAGCYSHRHTHGWGADVLWLLQEAPAVGHHALGCHHLWRELCVDLARRDCIVVPAEPDLDL